MHENILKEHMILPIVAYGDSVLKKTGKEITKEYSKLDELIANMYETMYNALGVGLANVIKGRSPLVDGFGLIAFASLLPMIFVMGYGLFWFK